MRNLASGVALATTCALAIVATSCSSLKVETEIFNGHVRNAEATAAAIQRELDSLPDQIGQARGRCVAAWDSATNAFPDVFIGTGEQFATSVIDRIVAPTIRGKFDQRIAAVKAEAQLLESRARAAETTSGGAARDSFLLVHLLTQLQFRFENLAKDINKELMVIADRQLATWRADVKAFYTVQIPRGKQDADPIASRTKAITRLEQALHISPAVATWGDVRKANARLGQAVANTRLSPPLAGYHAFRRTVTLRLEKTAKATDEQSIPASSSARCVLAARSRTTPKRCRDESNELRSSKHRSTCLLSSEPSNSIRLLSSLLSSVMTSPCAGQTAPSSESATRIRFGMCGPP